MPLASLTQTELNFELTGPSDTPVVVLAHGLGTDMRLWEPILPHLPEWMQILRYDLRGHGLSRVNTPPYSMGSLVRDAEQLLDHLQLRDAVFVGHSLGGMVGQGLAVKRLDQIRALVLTGSSAKLNTPSLWQRHMDEAESLGLDGIADAVMERWFSRNFQTHPNMPRWRDIFTNQSLDGYLGGCAAIAGTDFYTPTSGLRLPALAIAGSDDRVTPPDLIRETIDLIPGSRFRLLRRAGHLTTIDQPVEFAEELARFLKETGHIG